MFDDAFGAAPATTAPQADPAADFINREQVWDQGQVQKI